MTQQIINVGTLPNDGEGDPLRTAFQKINQNFTQVFTAPGAAGQDGSFQYRNLNSLSTAAFYDVRWVLGGRTQWWTSTDAQSFDKLTSYTPTAEINQIIAVPTGFIGVGSANTIVTSADGLVWIPQTSASAADFTGIAQGNTGRFVAVGAGGKIQTSLNAIDWTDVVSGTSTNLNSIAYSNLGWVAVGNSGTILFSGNATNWTVVTPVLTSANLNSVVYNGSYYVAVGNNGKIFRSANGTVWTEVVTTITENLNGIVTAVIDTDRIDIVVGDNGAIYISRDFSATWDTPTSYTLISSNLTSVCYYNQLYMAVGLNGSVLTSPDGEDWTNASIPGILTSSQQLTYNELTETLNIDSTSVAIKGNITINTSGASNTIQIGYTDVGNVNIRTSTTINGKLRIPVYNTDPNNTVSNGGDIFYDANTGYIKWFDAVDNQWRAVSTSSPPGPKNALVNGNNSVTLESNGETIFPGNILPANTLAYDLGSSSHRFRDLYLSGNTIYLGDAILTSTNGTFIVDGSVYASENYVSNSVAAVIGQAPIDLDTLEKIANSINNNSDFYAWVNNQLALKANTAGLANVAFTGEYSDLANTPVLANVAYTGAYSDLTGTPTLATVATTGSYTDLVNTPVIPTVNSGTLSAASETVGSTNTTVSLTFSDAYNANSSNNVTIGPVVGPALTSLASVMTSTGEGFLKKTGSDTYAIDANTYVTAESDTLATVTARGATTNTSIVVNGNVTATYLIGDGSQITGLPPGYTNNDVVTLLSNLGSNTINSTANIVTTANVSGNYILGNGSLLTGIPAGYSNANVATFLASFGSNSISTTGDVTANNFIGNIQITGDIYGTSPDVSLVAGNYTMTFDNTGILRLPTMGGDEGGEINLGIPETNTTLTTRVVMDVYRDRFRIFDGSTKGVYIDLSQAGTGVSTLLNNRVSGYVNAGSFVTMDNIRATVTTSGQRGLSLATVTGFFTYDIGGTYGAGVGSGGASLGGQTLTTTPTSSIFNWGFVAIGDISTYIITNTSSMQTYRITLQIGASFNNNFISIERLI